MRNDWVKCIDKQAETNKTCRKINASLLLCNGFMKETNCIDRSAETVTEMQSEGEIPLYDDLHYLNVIDVLFNIQT